MGVKSGDICQVVEADQHGITLNFGANHVRMSYYDDNAKKRAEELVGKSIVLTQFGGRFEDGEETDLVPWGNR